MMTPLSNLLGGWGAHGNLPPRCIRYGIAVLPVLAGVNDDRSLEHVATNRTQKPRIYFIRHVNTPLGAWFVSMGGVPTNHAHYTAAVPSAR